MARMSDARAMVLYRAAQQREVLPGTALMYEQQFGKLRQVNWLLRNGYIRQSGGRLVATRKGRSAVTSHQSAEKK